jgi:hypothetical protein
MEETAGFLANPPSVLPHPNFYKLQALRKYIVDTFQQLQHPTCPVYGWAGMETPSSIYALIGPVPFILPQDPGPIAMYPQWVSAFQIKMTDSFFKRDKNIFASEANINRVVIFMLNKCVPNQFKISNNPILTGWNPSMSIKDILTQLETTYGQPDAAAILANDNLFRLPFQATNAPEALFYRLEQCQEVAVIANNLYSVAQMITMAVRLLRAANIFPLKDF